MHLAEFKSPEFTKFHEKFGFKPVALGAQDIHNLPVKSLYHIADQASKLIHMLGEKTMFHPPAELLMQYMQAGLAVPIIDSKEALGLIGFVKTLPWFKGNPQPSEQDVFTLLENGIPPVAFESGSLVVSPHYQQAHVAFDMKNAFARYVHSSFPNVPIFAVITDTNTPSLKNNVKSGWVAMAPEQAVNIFQTDVLDGWNIPSQIFVYPPSISHSDKQ